LSKKFIFFENIIQKKFNNNFLNMRGYADLTKIIQLIKVTFD